MSLSYYEATLKLKNRRKCTYQIILLRSDYNVFKNISYNKHPNTFVSLCAFKTTSIFGDWASYVSKYKYVLQSS